MDRRHPLARNPEHGVPRQDPPEYTISKSRGYPLAGASDFHFGASSAIGVQSGTIVSNILQLSLADLKSLMNGLDYNLFFFP